MLLCDVSHRRKLLIDAKTLCTNRGVFAIEMVRLVDRPNSIPKKRAATRTA
jgi:hypothetical protein